MRDCIFLSPKKEVLLKNIETLNDFMPFKLASVRTPVNFFILPEYALRIRKMDDLRIYNCGLSNDEIGRIYEGTDAASAEK